MDQTLINRYQAVNPDTGQPGDLYVAYTSQFGVQGANSIASSAQSGDRTAITAAIEQLKYGAPLPTSTAAAFGNQLLTDPFAAPLADANTLVGNSVLSFLKNPWVLFAFCLGVFFYFGGADIIRGWFRRKANS